MIRHHPPSRKLLSPEMFNRESRFQPINRTRMTRIGGEQFEHAGLLEDSRQERESKERGGFHCAVWGRG